MKQSKRILSFLLCLVLLFGAVPLMTQASTNGHSQNDAVNWANSQNGKSIDTDGFPTWQPYQCVDLLKAYYNYLGASAYTGGDAVAYQTRSIPSGWSRIRYSEGITFQPGDVAVWKTNLKRQNNYSTTTTGDAGHVGIILSADSVGFNAAEQNAAGKTYVTINWHYNSELYCVIRPDWNSSPANQDPKGDLDSASGGSGTVTVSGWAFDPDVPNQSIDVHVYIGAPAGQGGECHIIKADKPRDDVNKVYGISGKHGFSESIKTSKTGTLKVYVYAINDKSGNNPEVWDSGRTVNVSPAVQKYYLDINGYLDGKNAGGIGPHGTVDIYINGKRVADDCSDFYSANGMFEKGSTYEINDIKAAKGYEYKGVKSGSLKGTLNSDTIVVLSFSKVCTHTWNPGTVTKAATCTSTGIKKYTCTSCGATKEEEIAKTSHSTVLRNKKDATCTATGYSGDSVCSVCGTVVKQGTTINKKDHTLTTINKTDATCTKAGYTGDQYCTTCKQTITKGKTINALGHTAPNRSGNCSRCGEHIQDVEEPACAHNYQTVVTKKATFTQDGVIADKCSKCGNVRATETIAKVSNVYLAETSFIYDGKAKYPDGYITDSNNKELPGNCYSAVAKDNVNIGTGKVVITLKGNYSGTKTLSFEILPGKVENLKAEPASSSSVALTWDSVPGATGYDVYCYYESVGGYLKLGSVSSPRATINNVGSDTYTYAVVATANGKQGKEAIVQGAASHDIPDTPPALDPTQPQDSDPDPYSGHEHDPIIDYNKATFGEDGFIERYCDECGYTFYANAIPAVETVKLTKTKFSYDGKSKKPGVTVLDREGNALKEGEDYTLSYSKGRTAIGTYQVKVTLIGHYEGTKTLKFKIIPAKVTGLKVTAGKKVAQLKWKAVPGAKNYVIYYATSKTGTFKKAFSTSGTTAKVMKLKSGKTYYFRVRAVAKLDSGTFNGSLSAIKKAKIK